MDAQTLGDTGSDGVHHLGHSMALDGMGGSGGQDVFLGGSRDHTVTPLGDDFF